MDLRYALGAARRHWVLIVAFVLLGAFAGLAHGLLAETTYRAKTTVLFSLNRGGAVSELADGNNYVQDLVPSYAKVAETPLVLSPVIDRLNLEMTPAQLAGQVDVSLEPASLVLQISVGDAGRERSAAIANAIADQLGQALITLSPRSATNTAAITLTKLAPATAPNFPSSPNKRLSLAAGLMGGLLLGLGAVAIRESIATPTISTRTELARVADFPVLGSIVNDGRASIRPLPMSTHPDIPRAHSFRMLQTNLFGRRARTTLGLVVCSAQPGDGRTGTAVNLAIAMTHASMRTLLVDADLRRPGVAPLVGLDNSVGLSSVLRGQATVDGATRKWLTQIWGTWSLDVMTSGPPVTSPSELLASQAMTAFVEQVRAKYDVVVLDSPPLLQSTDGAMLASLVDGALLVVDSTRTKERHIHDALGRLRMAGADVLGFVLNRSAAETQPEYTASRSRSRGLAEEHRHDGGAEQELLGGAPAAFPPAADAAAPAALPVLPRAGKDGVPASLLDAFAPPPEPDPRPDPKPEPKPKPDAKPEPKPEPTPEPTPEPKPEPKPAAARTPVKAPAAQTPPPQKAPPAQEPAPAAPAKRTPVAAPLPPPLKSVGRLGQPQGPSTRPITIRGSNGQQPGTPPDADRRSAASDDDPDPES